MSHDSHFVEEHIEQAAYLHARGRSWAAVAAELKHPDADRLRRGMFKDPAFRAALDLARDELARECLAESVHTLRTQLREPEHAFEAANKLMEYAEAHADRQHELALAKIAEDGKTHREQLKIAARERLQKEALDARHKVELLKARARVQGGEGLPLSEKERLRKEREDRAFDERYHAASRRTTAYLAEEANREKEPLWIPSGEHPIGYGQLPDHTDQPVRLYQDFVNGKPIYWIVAHPVPMMVPNGYVPSDPDEPTETDTPMG